MTKLWPQTDGRHVCTLTTSMLLHNCECPIRVAAKLAPRVRSRREPVAFEAYDGSIPRHILSLDELAALEARIPDGSALDRDCIFIRMLAEPETLEAIAPDHPQGEFTVNRTAFSTLCPDNADGDGKRCAPLPCRYEDGTELTLKELRVMYELDALFREQPKQRGSSIEALADDLAERLDDDVSPKIVSRVLRVLGR